MNLTKFSRLAVFSLLLSVLLISCSDDESVNLPPSFDGAVYAVTENMSNGTVVGTLTATDPESNELTFSITSGNTGTAFILDETSGELSINDMNAIDFETAASFNLSVAVTDGINTVNGIVVVNVGDDTADNETQFQITLYNTVDLLSSTVFNTPAGASAAGPAPNAGDSYVIDFKAVPGTYLSFATMEAMSNDWFYAPDVEGIALYNGSGEPVTGDITGQVMLWDAGTEEENPAAWAAVDPNDENGTDDDNTAVRLQQSDVTDRIEVILSFIDGQFNLTITNLAGAGNGTVITPGLAVVHALDYPLFEKGAADPGYGLKQIAEDGNPAVLYGFLAATGTDGDSSPLRLSSSHTPFAPGLAYVFPGDEMDPLFTQGEVAVAESGLETLAEDGSAATAVTYLTDQGYAAVAADQMAPVHPGQVMTFTVTATPGDKFGFATMFIQSNDWFLSFNNNGVELFNEDGSPKSGVDYSVQSYLYDAGTEEDEEIGFGANQAPRQSAGNTGAADDDTTIRRVGEINDMQFGKGTLTSAAGVVASEDARGGYNIILVRIEPIN